VTLRIADRPPHPPRSARTTSPRTRGDVKAKRHRSRAALFVRAPSFLARQSQKPRRNPNLRRMIPAVEDRNHQDRTRHAVARIERSEIRGRSSGFIAAPGFHFVQPGLLKSLPATKKEAERRKAQCLQPPHLRAARAQKRRAHAFRRSTAALVQRTHASQGLSSGPGFVAAAPSYAGLARSASSSSSEHLACRS
jgi:hypothetical protein